MEPTAVATPAASPPSGRFGREPQPTVSAPIAAVPAAAPPPALSDTRVIARRWPRSVPPKRVFPRG